LSADTVYSATLLIAFTAGAGALAGALMGRTARWRATRWARSVGLNALLASTATLVSFGVHAAYGHAPGSPEDLSPWEFVREHVSFIGAALLPAVAVVIRSGATR
jgi:hypothetical protein